MPTWMKRGLIGLFLLLFAAAGVVLALSVQRVEGSFSPVFSPDGKQVYFIARETRGLVLGFGYEFYSPPAHVFLREDRFSLRRVPSAGGAVGTVKSWPGSPLEGEKIRAYRGRIFSVAPTELHWAEGEKLEYKVSLRIPAQPSGGHFSVSRQWNGESGELIEKDQWEERQVMAHGSGEAALSGSWELFAVKGEEGYPCAVVAYEQATAEIRVLVKTPVCDELYPEGISEAHVAPLSRREDIERVRNVRDTHDRLMREALAEGLAEYEAWLRVNRQMQDLGLYPKPPQLTARLLGAGELEELRNQEALEPVFEIAGMQFKVGMLRDIMRAIESPGEKTEKSMGQYIVHDDYTTSQALNAFLKSGGTRFYVAYQGRVYELNLWRP